MAYMADCDAVQNHLRDALRGRRRWIFLTDDSTGHQLLVGIAAGLILRGVADDDLGYGCLDFVNLPSGHRVMLSFLTAPKVSLSREVINRILRAAGCDEQLQDSEQDLLTLTAPGIRAETLLAFMTAIEASKCFGGGAKGIRSQGELTDHGR